MLNRHLLSLLFDGSANSLARSDQTDVGISSGLVLALASSVIPVLLPLNPPCGRSARSRGRAGWQRFHVLQRSRDGSGPLYTPAARSSRGGTVQDPHRAAYLLVQACQSLWLVTIDDAYERSFGFNRAINSSASPDRDFRLGYIVRRASDPRRSASDACLRRIPVAKHRAGS